MVNDVTLRHVRCFRAVAQTLNFHRAADQLNMDQSRLSKIIIELEDRLGIQLFQRSQRSIRLTPAGEQMLSDSEDLVTCFEHVVRQVREVDGKFSAPLRIGIADGLAQPLLSQRFAAWRLASPRTGLNIDEMRASELAAALRREEVDVGFSFGVAEEAGIAQEAAWSYPLVVLVPSAHVLTRHDHLTLAQVVRHPLIVCDPHYKPGVHRQIDVLIRRHTDFPRIADQASSLAGFITKIGTGCGIGLADAGHMLTVNRPDIVSIPLRDDTASLTTYVLYKRLKAGIPLMVTRFVEHMKTPI
jgi:DNA-binding transcriptional LysR family regulator